MPRPRLFADEPEVVRVRDLRVGDFLVEFAPQRGIAGVRVDSGVADLAQEWGVWGESNGYRRRRLPVESTRVRTLRGQTLTIPSHLLVTVRRKLDTAQVPA